MGILNPTVRFPPQWGRKPLTTLFYNLPPGTSKGAFETINACLHLVVTSSMYMDLIEQTPQALPLHKENPS